MKLRGLICLLLISCGAPAYRQGYNAQWVADTESYGTPVPLDTLASSAPLVATSLATPASMAYGEAARKILAHARADRSAYNKLAELTDTIGARLSGSPQLDKAITWAAATMQRDGLTSRTEKVMVPHWQRGTIDVSLTAPITRPLHALALGGSIATPKAGITARVVVVTSWEDLEAKKDQIPDAIVLYDVPMPTGGADPFAAYGATAAYRGIGASRAAAHGAAAVLVRSVTTRSLRTPHTGSLRYVDEISKKKIPAAAVTVEDSQLIARLAANGPVTVKLRMDPKNLPDVSSANVLGELRGREKPDEIIVLGAHIDSWDVGQGAHDDGAGCVMMMQAVATLKQLGLTPRRTIRVVLFTNEENGLRGAAAYAKDHAAEIPNHVFAMEADTGGFAPRALSVRAKANEPLVLAQLTDIASLAASTGLREVSPGHSGADIGALADAGVPTAGWSTKSDAYFDIHHTDADTLDKVNPQHLADAVAAIATLAYVIADQPDRLGAPTKTP